MYKYFKKSIFSIRGAPTVIELLAIQLGDTGNNIQRIIEGLGPV
jgi:hypothetical protein